MIMIWRFTMPLLSTLAALIIIVHSAEEDLDPEYRYDLRPRVLDTGTSRDEQPWRLVEREPEMRHTTQSDWDPPSHEDPPKRRRKRKRRPIDSSTDDQISQERYTYPDAPPQFYHEADDGRTYETTEIPRRRRKRINMRPNRWDDESIEPERLIRRRGQRRKRPSLDNWAALSEFSGNRRGNSPPEIDKAAKLSDTIQQVDENEKQNHHDHERQLTEFNDNKWNILKPKSDIMPQETNDRIVFDVDLSADVQSETTQMEEDKSLSEFSSENVSPKKVEVKENYLQTKIKDKIPKILNPFDNEQSNMPIDPVTLKEILKRSNGTSLSEILQQHNLSLADLLHGKENVISILQSDDSLEPRSREILTDSINDKLEAPKINDEQEIQAHESKTPSFSSNQAEKEAVIERPDTTDSNLTIKHESELGTTSSSKERYSTDENLKRRPNLTLRRRFPLGIRKLRMRPILNGTYKGQLSRDMLALNARRYHRRNTTKSQEWKTLIPLIANMNTSKETQNDKYVTEPMTTTTSSEEPTTIDDDKTEVALIVSEDMQANSNDNVTDIEVIFTETETIPTTTLESTITETEFIVTEKPVVTPIIRQLNSSSIRRQAYNNRLKKKRLKQKNSTTESPQDDMIKNLFGLGNLVSSSEFIAKTTMKKELSPEGNTDFTGLEDFLTTAMSRKMESSTKSITSSSKPTRSSTKTPIYPATTPRYPATWVTTEETAKFEIEEILNDTRTSAKLSRILMERNMTLNELVEHRERGSSHVHLADIFHNASREPNPPEPFLSKSLIEPISKETYPLRVLLDANLHDPTAKATTIDPILSDSNYMNIPVVMDFGNNVNENAENMGIMSLFDNFTQGENMHKTLQKDSDGTPYESTIIHVNATNLNDINRMSRVLDDNQDMVSWNEIFTMIRNTQNKGAGEVVETHKKEISPPETYKKIILEEDVDGDGLIVLEDLQHLRDFESNIAPASDEKFTLDSYERSKDMPKPGILTKPSSNTKSVTVATASIVGLALVLFLLTYAAFKWIQQRKKDKKRTFVDDRIPTPVFEHRKGHKHNSSNRSISPMLSTSNIYTMNTLETHHGKDSPEYMWDTLRKPFQ